jgi:predicted CopG family antitoxin
MDFSYDNYNNFSAQHASPSGRTPAPINYTHNFYPHKPCSYCSNHYHSSSNCPSLGQFCNPSYEQMNTNFSSPRFDSNSNFYNPDWSNHSPSSSYNYPAQKSSLEDTIKAYTQKMKHNIQELRSVQANFSNSGFDSNSNFCNPDWSNHSEFSWQDQATRNYAPLHNELHHLEYSQFKNQVLHPSLYDPLPKKLSLEETLQAFIQTSNRNIQELKKVTMSNDQIMQELKQSRQELKNATMSNSQAIKELTHEIRDSTQFTHQAFAKKEEQIDYLVAEFNRMEEEELQSQLMAEGHYKIDEDDASHSCHENIPDTIILESNEIEHNE